MDELTALEADELIDKIAIHEARIKFAEQERDAFIARYNEKISAARTICDDKCKSARESIAYLTELLRRFAEANVSDKKRSVSLPSGTLAFRKNSPRFFFDDLKEANSADERLIHFVKHNAADYLKVKVEESVDWAKFKAQLEVGDEGLVSFKATGEVIDGLHAQIVPDSFTVKINGGKS